MYFQSISNSILIISQSLIFPRFVSDRVIGISETSIYPGSSLDIVRLVPLRAIDHLWTVYLEKSFSNSTQSTHDSSSTCSNLVTLQVVSMWPVTICPSSLSPALTHLSMLNSSPTCLLQKFVLLRLSCII